jgi:GT2 family glycosyltransferase
LPSPALSVVVPDLDSPFVDRTLAALAADGAPGEDVEVLVVGRDAPGLVPRDGPVVFLETAERLNPAAARNRGAAAARGRKILFTDADCRPQAGWLRALSAALDRAPVAGGAVDFPRNGSRWALADNIASFHDLLPDRPAEEDSRRPLGSLNLAVRRDAWDRLRGFDESLATSEDHDWVLRARTRGLATSFVPAAIVEHDAVRTSRAAVAAHARWYGEHFHRFRAIHPKAFGTGPTWRSRRRLALAAPWKAVLSSLGIFLSHPQLLASLRALPGVVAFRRAWYDAVLASWPEPGSQREQEIR